MIDDDMDFTKPEVTPAPQAAAPAPAFAASGRSRYYDPAVAAKLFRAFGRAENFAAGDAFFVENEKAAKHSMFSATSSNKMFLLLKGEVVLTAGNKTLDTIRADEIFGEMAVVSGTPRSATATARGACEALALDAQQFQAAIAQFPEFALMLMSVIFDRLRLVAARISARKIVVGDDRIREGQVFDAKTLQALQKQIDNPTQLRYNAEKIVMREGEAGAYMYVVLSGRIGIAIKGNVVESIATGGAFGEMALVDQSPRTASAFAQTDTELLALNRTTMLQLVKTHPAFGVALLKAVSDRLRYMNALLA